MCMWQSVALAGAFSLGRLVPTELGTGVCARTSRTEIAAVPAAANPTPCKNVRRSIIANFSSDFWEAVERLRIVDENAIALALIGRPYGQEIEQHRIVRLVVEG